MTERERFIELLESGCYEALSKCKGENKDKKLCEFLADFLLKNGVIVLPLNMISNTLWFINCDNNIVCDKINKITICDSHDVYIFLQNSGDEPYELSDIGKFLFYTREEAEKALAERSNI